MNSNGSAIFGNTTARAIAVLIIVAILFTVFSIMAIYFISHNVYAASYYTLSTLFDSNSEGAPLVIATAIAGNSNYLFYSFIAVSLIDGLAKVVIIAFIIAAFINLLSSLDIKSRFDIITARRLKGHIIICGYSMLAERLCNDLKERGMHFVIIDKDPEKVNMLRDLKFNVVEGDFTERKVLYGSSIEMAKAVVFSTESDFINLLGIVTAHHISPHVKIIARAQSESTIRKMQRGGASLCLVPEVVAGIELGEMISKTWFHG